MKNFAKVASLRFKQEATVVSASKPGYSLNKKEAAAEEGINFPKCKR